MPSKPWNNKSKIAAAAAPESVLNSVSGLDEPELNASGCFWVLGVFLGFLAGWRWLAGLGSLQLMPLWNCKIESEYGLFQILFYLLRTYFVGTVAAFLLTGNTLWKPFVN